MALSKTAAIRESANAVSISGSGTSWQVYGPHKATNHTGPTTAVSATSYVKARRCATEWRAEVVLALMGLWSDDVQIAIGYHGINSDATTLADYIAIGLKAAKRG